MTHEVWVTGIGSLTNLGSGFESLLSATLAPRAPFSSTPQAWLDQSSSVPNTFMAKLDASAEAELLQFQTVATDRATAMGLAAAHQAWQHSQLQAAAVASAPARAGVFWGTGMGGCETLEGTYRRFLLEKAQPRPMTVVRIMANSAAAAIAMKYGIQGPNQTYSVACASSAMAMGEAMWAIRSGRLDLAIVGGSDAMLFPGVMAGWGALKVLAMAHNTPMSSTPCRPFSQDRSGLVIGEGAAAFVLESQRHALARGARGLARLAGYASTCDASSWVLPAVSGQVAAMRGALMDAGIASSAVDSVNAHATGTDAGDCVEYQALMDVFGAQTCPPVTATKSMHGHALGAAGAVEAAMGIATLQTQTTPATVGLEPLDARCARLNVCAQPRASAIQTVLSNSFAFGGSNVSLIFQALKP